MYVFSHYHNDPRFSDRLQTQIRLLLEEQSDQGLPGLSLGGDLGRKSLPKLANFSCFELREKFKCIESIGKSKNPENVAKLLPV